MEEHLDNKQILSQVRKATAQKYEKKECILNEKCAYVALMSTHCKDNGPSLYRFYCHFCRDCKLTS